MPQVLQCPHCQGSISVADDDAGHRLTCPLCDQDFVAPGGKAADATQDSEEDDWLKLDSVSGGDLPASVPTSSTPPAPSTPSDTPATDELGVKGPRLRKPAKGPAGPQQLSEDELLERYANGTGDTFADDFAATTESLPDSLKSSGSKNQPGFSGQELPEFAEAAVPPPGKRTEPEYAQEYRIKCLVCGTPRYVKAKQAGKTVQCVDCHSSMDVPAPPKVVKKNEPVPMEHVQALPMQEPASGERAATPFQKSAAKLIEEAEMTHVDEPPANYDTPDVMKWLVSVFGIFKDLSVVLHWIALSVALSVPAYLVIVSMHPVLIIAMTIVSAIGFVVILTCSFAIMESAANQEERVTQWPVFDPGEWMGQTFIAAAAAAVPLVPINAVGLPIFGAGIILLLLNMLAFYAVFPFILLSMLDMGTAMAPFSTEVARSVTKCQEAWGGFYFSAGLLFAAAFVLFVALFSLGVSGVGVVLSVFIGVALLMTYFQMIGHLAFAIGQAVNAPTRQVESID